MIKYALVFLAGCLATVLFDVGWSYYAAVSALSSVRKVKKVEVDVTVHVAEDPSTLRPVKDIPSLLDRVAGLSDDEKKRILEGAASGFITTLRISNEKDGRISSIVLSPGERFMTTLETERPKDDTR